MEIQNVGGQPVNVLNWTLRDSADHVYTFPSYAMQPGQVCRVYTNEWHSEWCNFNYQSGSAIWNNGGDCGYLRDEEGVQVSEYCY